MDSPSSVAFNLLRRQDADAAGPAADAAPAGCQADEVVRDYAQLRIASIFIIMVGSLVGALLPLWLSRSRSNKNSRLKRYAFFIAKYFGSGVIVSTAFMHLISPANEILGMECLEPLLGTYDWTMAIVLITVMVMFLIELLASWLEAKRDSRRGSHASGHSHSHHHHHHGGGASRFADDDPEAAAQKHDVENGSEHGSSSPQSHQHHHQKDASEAALPAPGGATEDDGQTPPQQTAGGGGGGLPRSSLGYSPGSKDHLAHARDHTEGDSHIAFGGKVTSIVILEAGVVLHSIFIGLTLAVSSGFIILFIVLVFHQTFEGLGLGSRLATFEWPTRGLRRLTPWVFAVMYGLATPLAIAVGLGVKEALQDDPTRRFLVEGFSNAISGGILLYTGVVELMAHEFMFNPEMERAPLRYKLLAFGCMAFGAALMALLAKWA